MASFGYMESKNRLALQVMRETEKRNSLIALCYTAGDLFSLIEKDEVCEEENEHSSFSCNDASKKR